MKGFRSPRSGRGSFSSSGEHSISLLFSLFFFPPLCLLPPSPSDLAQFLYLQTPFYRGHRRTLSNTSNISRVSFSSDHYTHNHTFGDRSSVRPSSSAPLSHAHSLSHTHSLSHIHSLSLSLSLFLSLFFSLSLSSS